MRGDLYRLAAVPGSRPEDVSQALNRLTKSRGTDDWINVSPDGRFLLISTSRFGCASIGSCLAVVSANLTSAAPIEVRGSPIDPWAYGAVASGGRLVVYPGENGPHKIDLWAVSQKDGNWGPPRVITGRSQFPYNQQPAISADGTKILFDCGPDAYASAGTQICEVSNTGGAVSIVVRGGSKNALHHADFAPDGSIVFEGAWQGEQIWKLRPGSKTPRKVQDVHDDNSPCVLPDGRIVSLWLDRPGNAKGFHELKVMSPNGRNAQMLLTGDDVLDVGIGCGA
jgi:Tol biopolymer transport system component